ncbi:hypothetical protein RFI_32349 [Reticulomyxa filosa]|uniref:Ubiquitin-like domain-containing protein n=1 Tax=Reticulomyxa filosa TaxID=46433 RepID=X6LUJ0_RETFI|nr:hypothetical protein RFI_32349 [Reticulomyxa filosa]|eukprot:ETO05046.1 hypothetical protein RFI_32349 [Reticulomyxa filosa]
MSLHRLNVSKRKRQNLNGKEICVKLIKNKENKESKIVSEKVEVIETRNENKTYEKAIVPEPVPTKESNEKQELTVNVNNVSKEEKKETITATATAEVTTNGKANEKLESKNIETKPEETTLTDNKNGVNYVIKDPRLQELRQQKNAENESKVKTIEDKVITISIKSIDNGFPTMQISISWRSTVYLLKKEIQKSSNDNIDVARQRLIHKGRVNFIHMYAYIHICYIICYIHVHMLSVHFFFFFFFVNVKHWLLKNCNVGVEE